LAEDALQEYQGPKVPWLDGFQRAGLDYRNLPLPACRRRCATAVEMRFDFLDPDPTMVDRMAEIILKVEAGIDELRAHEKAHGPAPLPRR
jgi:hypothetical protein